MQQGYAKLITDPHRNERILGYIITLIGKALQIRDRIKTMPKRCTRLDFIKAVETLIKDGDDQASAIEMISRICLEAEIEGGVYIDFGMARKWLEAWNGFVASAVNQFPASNPGKAR